MHKLIINEDGIDHVYECANGFVSRCVAAIHAENFADARRVCEILNADSAAFEASAPRSAWWESDNYAVASRNRQS